MLFSLLLLGSLHGMFISALEFPDYQALSETAKLKLREHFTVTDIEIKKYNYEFQFEQSKLIPARMKEQVFWHEFMADSLPLILGLKLEGIPITIEEYDTYQAKYKAEQIGTYNLNEWKTWLHKHAKFDFLGTPSMQKSYLIDSMRLKIVKLDISIQEWKAAMMVFPKEYSPTFFCEWWVYRQVLDLNSTLGQNIKSLSELHMKNSDVYTDDFELNWAAETLKWSQRRNTSFGFTEWLRLVIQHESDVAKIESKFRIEMGEL